MKIAGSSIFMASSRQLVTLDTVRQTTAVAAGAKGGGLPGGAAAVYEGAGEAVPEADRRQEEQGGSCERRARDWEDASRMLEQLNRTKQNGMPDVRSLLKDLHRQLLDRMLELLDGLRGVQTLGPGELSHGKVLDLRSSSVRMAGARSQLFRLEGGEPAVGTTAGGTLWKRVSTTSVSHAEYEHTAFQSRGCAVTEDGRSISFDVGFSLSRSSARSFEAITSEEFLMTDPLIINLESGAASVSRDKFQFDLDGDGQTEEISFAGEGSGFLALDLNGNGKIDDGSELFGTESGDGFADLAKYDGDGNRWIDENDAVYSRLRVWTRDAQGNETLMGLKEANVGAIYLGSVGTQFSLKDAETDETSAMIRRTGIFLRENGGAGTLSHVDLRC